MTMWMIVEDEPDMYEVLLAMFEMWGIEGVAFVDGEEAAAWIEDVNQGRFKGELPQLALLDIRLPGEVTGIMLGELLRKTPALRHIAIVLQTAYKISPDHQEQAMLQSGADGWIYKPLPKFAELKQILDKIISRKRPPNWELKKGK